MADLILHHFEGSPFSEKVRLILGYKQLAWKSVIVPAISPKPDVVALTGGYRKTPFLQIGADIYCDTALICEVLEHLQPTPTLYPQASSGLARVVAQWADSSLFWAAVTFNRGPKGTGSQFGGASTEVAKALFADRKAMGFDLEWVRPADAATPYQTYLRRLVDMLQDQPYLLGPHPSIADFCAYHPLWLAHVRVPAVMDLLTPMPKLVDWLLRMQSIEHGRITRVDAAQAIADAACTQPTLPGHGPLAATDFRDEHGIPLGSHVTITAESFGREPTAGELVASTPTHYTLRRSDDRAGTVHVHFPRIGYVLRQL